MNYNSIHFLKKKIDKQMKVFEYGMGGSTVFFARLTQEVVSVEHDRIWFESTKRRMENLKINNWEAILAVAEVEKTTQAKDPADPFSYVSSDKKYKNYNFEKYVNTIKSYPENYFDVIVIDGRSRPSCVSASVSKLKKGGYLVLDNTERDHYQPAIKEFLTKGFKVMTNVYGPTVFSIDFTRTMICRKIK
jgi:precorrin-6B methylase 2